MYPNRQKMHDADARRARQRPSGPTRPWKVPSVRVDAVGGSPGNRVGEAVSVHSLPLKLHLVYKLQRRETTALKFCYLRSPLAHTHHMPGEKGGDYDVQTQVSREAEGVSEPTPVVQQKSGALDFLREVRPRTSMFA